MHRQVRRLSRARLRCASTARVLPSAVEQIVVNRHAPPPRRSQKPLRWARPSRAIWERQIHPVALLATVLSLRQRLRIDRRPRGHEPLLESAIRFRARLPCRASALGVADQALVDGLAAIVFFSGFPCSIFLNLGHVAILRALPADSSGFGDRWYAKRSIYSGLGPRAIVGAPFAHRGRVLSRLCQPRSE